MLDRYHPTLREIGMKKCPVKLNKGLYEALDETGKPVSTINESIHKVCSHGTQLPLKYAQTISRGRAALPPTNRKRWRHSTVAVRSQACPPLIRI
jgi:hypothetical protein